MGYNTKAIYTSIKVECPHRHFVLGATDILAIGSKRLQCKFVMVTSSHLPRPLPMKREGRSDSIASSQFGIASGSRRSTSVARLRLPGCSQQVATQ
jgi:hypothetical protein